MKINIVFLCKEISTKRKPLSDDKKNKQQKVLFIE